MASTSRLKKRKDIWRTDDIDLGTGENGNMRISFDGLNEKSEKSIQARCSPTRFVNLCTKLKNEFRMAVREMGFSSLLEMSSCTIFRPLAWWLIENFDIEDASLCVHGKTFILNASSFEMVMGVKDGGEDFEQEGSLDDVKRRRAAVRDGNATLSLTQLENNLIEAESVDDLFVTRFVLFTVGTLLMPTTSVYVGTSIVGSITGSESVRKKNWATKSFTFLVDAIRDFKEKKGAFIGGCVLFLQVFYLHHLEGHNQYIDRSILPIAAWTEKKSKDVVAWINEGSGFGCEKIRTRETDNGCYKCQSMHNDIKTCKFEIQEVKQLVIGLQQSHREDIKKISKMVMDLVESSKSNRKVVSGESGGDRILELFESDQENVDRESGGGRIVELFESDRGGVVGESGGDDEFESGSQRQNTYPSILTLNANSIAMYKNFVCSGGLEIGPAKLTQPLSDSDSKKIAMYIIDKSLDKREIVVKFGDLELSREVLLEAFLPESLAIEKVINVYASLLNGVVGMQYEIPENRACCFLPCSLSSQAYFTGLKILLDDMDNYNTMAAEWRKYLGNLAKCNKIVIPVFTRYYWLMAVVNLREEIVVLWDSIADFNQETESECEDTAIETLRILDHVLADNIKMILPDGLSLQDFQIIHKRSVQRVYNRRDSAIYSLKHMRAASKGLVWIPKFNPRESLLELYIELVQSQFNKVRAPVLEKCTSHFDSLVRATTGLGNEKNKVSSLNSQDTEQFWVDLLTY